MKATRFALAVLAAFAAAAPAALTSSASPADLASGAPSQDEVPRRLLVFTVPGLQWADLDEHELPALERFADGAAVADLVPRSVRHRSTAGDAYLTISSGTRSIGIDAVDGQVLRVGEAPFDATVAEVFQRRTGEAIDDGSVVLGWAQLDRRNDREPYDAELGALADTLRRGGVATMAVGNADGSDDSEISHHRQVGLALAGRTGAVPDGQLGTDLLTTDPSRPFGLRLDPQRVTTAFEEVWDDGDPLAAVVEASDLARTMRYAPLIEREQYDLLRATALREADDLFADLLEQVDPERDAVLVLGPYAEPGESGLTVAALRTPTGASGYLRTASTQRTGIVTLVDVAPTILDLFDLTAPASMEGRPFELVRSSAPFPDRADHLIDIDEGSEFREHLLTPTSTVVVLGMAAVCIAAAVAIAGGWSAAARSRIRFAALADLSLLPMSYLARAFPLEDLGLAFYWAFVVAGAVAAATAATLVARRARRPRLGLVIVLAAVLVVLLVDVMTGSSLSLNAAFGYSPGSNSRLYGISNYSYGQVAGAACVLAGLLAARSPRWRWAAFGMLAGVLVVLGMPIWGSDVGGVLAFTPALLLFAGLVLGYRIRLRTVVIAGVATVAAIVGFGFLDLARPPQQRAHLGRLFERIDREGLEPLMSVIERKLLANLEVSTTSFWVLAVPIAAAFWLFLARHRTQALARVRDGVPTLGPALAAAAVAAVLGSVLNDSGAIVGGVALTVVAVSLAHLATEPEPDPELRS